MIISYSIDYDYANMSSEIPFPLPDAELGKFLSRLLMYLSDENTRLPLTAEQVKRIVKGKPHANHAHGG